ncbi:hypothetical protein [Microbacterium stercoris]|uniref:Uncharacterized protein n=1 Tax=Microbacterium stercoris TaxID=2820289 RepID=A0A939QID1_9MICO|nr:hypothetical protein [Microbacterium stercoris]MBO3663408.1 hypothetical protein [Microbacterium stercoris]
MNAELPAIHEWYPKLSMDAKHALQEETAAIPDEVRAEIGDIVGFAVPEGATLSEEDRDFIRTQGEQVD